MFLQSINQNLADTVVVNDTQSFTKVNGVDPVTSSHCAREGPPIYINNLFSNSIILSKPLNNLIEAKIKFKY